MFQWVDYESKYAQLIDSWLDEEAVSMTGLDMGWDAYWLALKEDAANYPGCADFCKVVFENSMPFAAVCYGIYQNTMTVSEIVVAPELRGNGMGTRVLSELTGIAKGFGPDVVSRITAVVFPQNIASQWAFRKAGFHLEKKTDDDVDLIFTHQL